MYTIHNRLESASNDSICLCANRNLISEEQSISVRVLQFEKEQRKGRETWNDVHESDYLSDPWMHGLIRRGDPEDREETSAPEQKAFN